MQQNNPRMPYPLVVLFLLEADGAVEVAEGTRAVYTGGLGQVVDGKVKRLDMVL